MSRTSLLAPLALAALLAGCTDPAKPQAEAAIQAAERTLTGARADAARYAPAELKAADEALAKAKALQAKQEHQAALAAATDASAKASAVAATALGRRQQEERDFAAAVAQLPQLFDLVRGRLAELSAAKKLPKGLTPAALQEARGELDSSTRLLDEVTAQAGAGRMAEAIGAARALRDRSVALAVKLGVPVGSQPPR